MSTAYARRIMMFGGGHVALAKQGNRAVIELRHAAKKNALSGKMMVELEAAVAQLEKSPEVAVVLLKGEGGFFCSGADLSVATGEMAAPREGAEMCAFMQSVTTRLHDLPIISLALVRGGAYGGGTELSTACDHRIFAQGAKFRCVHATMGLSPGWGGGARLARLVGRTRALRLLCGAELVGAEQALAMGLCDVMAKEEEFDAAVEAFIEPYLASPTSAVRACKSVLAAADAWDTEVALKFELGEFAKQWGSPANLDAVKRALQGRKPGP
jgi:ethylmalonyl-CoA/methylmalonyl-CoA decarboxylase